MQTFIPGNKGGAAILLFVLVVTVSVFFISIKGSKTAEIKRWQKELVLWETKNNYLNEMAIEGVD